MKEFLLKLKKKHNLTVREMSLLLGVSMSALAKVLNGVRQPSKSFISKVKEKYPEFDVNKIF